MTRIEALKELADAINDGVWPVYAWSHLRIVYPSSWNKVEVHARNAHHGSLDAANALHEAVLPGWMWARAPDGLMMVEKYFDTPDTEPLFMSSMHINPARAWLLAIIRALIAEEEGK